MSDEIILKVTSYNQEGDRDLDDAAAAKLESMVVGFRFKSIAVTSVSGDSEAYRFAVQIKNYLAGIGYKVSKINQAIYTTPPGGVVINLPGEDRVLNIVVGSK